MSEPTSPAEPLTLRIVRGNPTTEEIAAVVCVLTALTRPRAVEPESDRPVWAAYWRSLRPSMHPGPGEWRHSGWPY